MFPIDKLVFPERFDSSEKKVVSNWKANHELLLDFLSSLKPKDYIPFGLAGLVENLDEVSKETGDIAKRTRCNKI